MTGESTLGLYLMRALYLLIFAGLALTIWPDIIHNAISGNPTPRATPSLLAAEFQLSLRSLSRSFVSYASSSVAGNGGCLAGSQI